MNIVTKITLKQSDLSDLIKKEVEAKGYVVSDIQYQYPDSNTPDSVEISVEVEASVKTKEKKARKKRTKKGEIVN